jgi:hypothetical protein
MAKGQQRSNREKKRPKQDKNKKKGAAVTSPMASAEQRAKFGGSGGQKKGR